VLGWKECYWVSCLAVAAIRNPKLKSGQLQPADREITKEKIRGIFKIGLEKKHDSLLVGALGCGAFHNPPADIAQIFKEVLQEYPNKFKKVVFAILEPRKKGQKKNRRDDPWGNLVTFRKTLVGSKSSAAGSSSGR
jgi:uncharacterized protein (TIGR02452 family)